MQTLLPSKFTGIIQLAPADESELLVLQEAIPVSYTHLRAHET